MQEQSSGQVDFDPSQFRPDPELFAEFQKIMDQQRLDPEMEQKFKEFAQSKAESVEMVSESDSDFVE